jgi:squalene synthase HpnC
MKGSESVPVRDRFRAFCDPAGGQSAPFPIVTTTNEPLPEILGDPSGFLALAREHYENFPVGSILVPRRLRRHVHRVYAFARTADDLADEVRDEAAFEAFRDSFVEHVEGRAASPVPLFADLCETIEEFRLPVRLFLDLLDAFGQDLRVSRYSSDAELFDYCRRSADPVGRIVLRIFGHDDPRLDAMSDRICTGLQLLNHLQDIGRDLRERDRIYFPATDLARFGVSEQDLLTAPASSAVRGLVAFWLDRTLEMFRDGWPLTSAVRGRLRLELRAIVRGACGVAVAIRDRDHDVLSTHVRLTRGQHVRVLAAALLTRRAPEVLR